MPDTITGRPLPDALVVTPQGDDAKLRTVLEDRPAAVFFMRASTCQVCLKHARTLAAMAGELADYGTHAVVVVPGGRAEAESVANRIGAGATVVASDPEAAHASAGLDRTLFLQHSGTFLVDDEGIVRYEKTAALPTGSFSAKDLRAALASPGVAR
jgi:peroxiredoxin